MKSAGHFFIFNGQQSGPQYIFPSIFSTNAIKIIGRCLTTTILIPNKLLIFNAFDLFFCVLDPPKVFLSGSLQSGLNVKRGYEICLDANISGSPYPQITWYWNNQVIQPEALRKRPERPLKKKVEKKEEKKEEGEDKMKEDKEKEEKKEGEIEKKKEEVAPEPEAEVEESDYPTINERLTINNRHRGVSSVLIKDSVRPDHGVYMVKVENDHGSASATCEVNVLGEGYFILLF